MIGNIELVSCIQLLGHIVGLICERSFIPNSSLPWNFIGTASVANVEYKVLLILVDVGVADGILCSHFGKNELL